MYWRNEPDNALRCGPRRPPAALVCAAWPLRLSPNVLLETAEPRACGQQGMIHPCVTHLNAFAGNHA